MQLPEQTELPQPSLHLPQATASWRAIFAIGAGAFVLITAEFLPVGLLPEIADALAITKGQAGLMLTIPGLVAACAALLTIGLTRNLDRRHLLCFLLGLLVLSNALVACATGLYSLLAGRLLLGVAVGGFWTVGVSLGPRLRPDAPGKATSIVFSGVTLGSVAGVPAGTLLGSLFGWRMAFGACAALVAVIVVVLLALLPAIRPERLSGIRQLPALMKLRKVQVGLIAVALIFIGQFSAYTYVTPFLSQVGGIVRPQVSAVLLAYGAAGILGNLLCGRLVEGNVRRAVLTTFLVLSCALLLLILSRGSGLATVCAMIGWGFGFGMLPIALQSWVFQAAPDRLESVAAVFVCVTQLAIGGGALVGGVAVDHFGVASATWLGVGGALAASLWVYASFPREAMSQAGK